MKMESMREVSDEAPGASSGRASTARVTARHLTKFYETDGRKNYALRDVSLEIEAGKMVVLLGPSGCGKTTLLRSIAGLETPQEGDIAIDGVAMYSASGGKYVPPERRNVSMVFQSYALWPHMSVRQNMEYPLRARKVSPPERRRRVDEVAQVVGLESFLERYPTQMSGGQQQRVALGRAIVAGSDVVLFDEPLSNVDAKVREQIRREISSLQRRFGFSGLYVTHDQVEASAIADQLVVMDHGVIVQMGPPEEVYNHPVNQYVATFMGSANCLCGVLEQAPPAWSGMAQVATGLGAVRGVLRGGNAAAYDGRAHSDSPQVDVMFRPEACSFSETEPDDALNRWPAVLKKRVSLGPVIENILEVQASSGQPLELIVTSPNSTAREGATGWVSVAPERTWVFPRQASSPPL